MVSLQMVQVVSLAKALGGERTEAQLSEGTLESRVFAMVRVTFLGKRKGKRREREGKEKAKKEEMEEGVKGKK